tara:strand:- start:1940 stop:2236 length:297 start_codon:yes stop_codon:yes gene_type:complete
MNIKWEIPMHMSASWELRQAPKRDTRPPANRLDIMAHMYNSRTGYVIKDAFRSRSSAISGAIAGNQNPAKAPVACTRIKKLTTKMVLLRELVIVLVAF